MSTRGKKVTKGALARKVDKCLNAITEVSLSGGMPYPGWNEWKVVFELKVNKYRMPQPEHVSDDL